MNLKHAKIFVTHHAVQRYRERLGRNYAPDEIEALCRLSKRVSITTRRRYRLRWSGHDNEGTSWRRYKDAFYLLREATGTDEGYVLVTVVSIAMARRLAKDRSRELTAMGRKKR
jgi:hypothetical protein